MAKLGKYLSIFLVIILAVSSLLMVIPVGAQTIPKPSVPEFTLEFSSQYNAVIVVIRNQPYNQSNGTLFYNLKLKEHNSADWTYPLDHLFYSFHNYPEQSADSQITNISLTVQSGFLVMGVQNDIEAEAMLGSIGRNGGSPSAPWAFTGQTSDWSNTETISIPDGSVSISSSPNPTPSPTVPEFPIATLLLAVLAVVTLLLVIGKRKTVTNH